MEAACVAFLQQTPFTRESVEEMICVHSQTTVTDSTAPSVSRKRSRRRLANMLIQTAAPVPLPDRARA